MYRIAHVSDLHLVAKGITINQTLLQRIAAMLGEQAGLKVAAAPYSEQRLESLKLAMRELQPAAIFITGDLTNYGDPESMRFAAQVIEDLRKEAGTNPEILVVPGNHDTLTERMAAVERDTSFFAGCVRTVRRLSPELALTSRLAEQLRGGGTGGSPPFLSTFWRYIPECYRPVDPAEPYLIDMRWGTATVFLFNSTVEQTFMANKGCIGPDAYNRLHGALTRRDRVDEYHLALKIALLHHHPISAPQSLDPDVVRLYDWMEDGPLLLQYLNHQQFSLIMHGHQHTPFVCTVNYQKDDVRPLHIVAAGSATQGGGSASFNVIDVLSPFELRVQRFDYVNPQFVSDPGSVCRLPIRSLSSIRLTPASKPEIAEDVAIRNLIKGSDDSYDTDIEYEKLAYLVEITKAQRYIADYQRVGIVRGRAGENGTVFVITGSPAMNVADMKLAATDNLASGSANVEIVSDDETRKVVRVSPRGSRLKIGQRFDITLHFEWQATDAEPNYFDAFNLMQIRHAVGTFEYRVKVPWQPARTSVTEYAIGKRDVCELQACTTGGHAGTELVAKLDHPRPAVYLFCFSEKLLPYLL